MSLLVADLGLLVKVNLIYFFVVVIVHRRAPSSLVVGKYYYERLHETDPDTKMRLADGIERT